MEKIIQRFVQKEYCKYVFLFFKVLWVVVTVFSIVSLVWFLIGSTTAFQRFWDVIGTAILIIVWTPCLILTLLSILFLKKGWIPSSSIDYIGFFCGVILLLLFSNYLIHSVNSNGWLRDKITSDSLKLTSDNKYEYRIDLINLFQRNSRAQLYIKNVSTGKEKNISIDISTEKIDALGIKEDSKFVLMEPCDTPDIYTLHTTEELWIPQERFEIDVRTGTSRRLE